MLPYTTGVYVNFVNPDNGAFNELKYTGIGTSPYDGFYLLLGNGDGYNYRLINGMTS